MNTHYVRRRIAAALLVLLSLPCLFITTTQQPADAATTDATGIATKPSNDGYWVTTARGAVTAKGSAAFFGDLQQLSLNRPITGITSTPTGQGYWLVASDGGIFAYGDARFFGSTGSLSLNKPVVGMAATPTGQGYWLVASDGGIFAYGDAAFFGSTGSIRLNQPITGMTASPSGSGYWLVASDGGIFAYGDAAFFGSTGSLSLNKPVVGMAASPSGRGYWLVASDGGIFAYGDAAFRGAGAEGSAAVFGMTTDGRGGYTLLRRDGAVVQRLAPVNQLAPIFAPPATNDPAPTTSTTTTQPPVATTTPPSTTPPVTTPPSTTPPTTSAPQSSNPFARNTWVDPSNPANAQANAWRTTRPGDAALMDRIGAYGAATWIGEWSGDVRSTVNAVTSAAAQTNSVPVLVAYNIPGRDCGQYSAGGANGSDAYKAWIRNLAEGIGNKPAAVILEPDAISQLDCLSASGEQDRLALLRDAVNVIESKPNAAVYIDAGHPGWHSAATIASRLNDAGVANARGFSLNVSNFVTTSANVSYGIDISNRTSGAKFVVDTSRNGNGSNGDWCNPAGRALGAEPTPSTGVAQADAFLWIKRPGESDGTCNGGPGAGQWWADYALGLAHGAWG